MHNYFPPRMIWTITATVNDVDRRDPSLGANPYLVSPYYTGGLFQLRHIATSGTITVLRVVIFGGLVGSHFPLAVFGFLDQHVIARWTGNFAAGLGQIRQPKSVDSTVAPITRRKLNLIPPALLVQWSTSAVGDPGATATMEVWASCFGPPLRGRT